MACFGKPLSKAFQKHMTCLPPFLAIENFSIVVGLAIKKFQLPWAQSLYLMAIEKKISCFTLWRLKKKLGTARLVFKTIWLPYPNRVRQQIFFSVSTRYDNHFFSIAIRFMMSKMGPILITQD
jgi:hypothetical protein